MRRKRFLPAVAVAILATSAGVAVAAASAAGHSLTLKVHRNVHDTNAMFASFAVKAVNTHEAVATGPAGFAVYTFQGETTHHTICKKTSNSATNCWSFWPPVSVSSPTGLHKQAGIRGHLGTFHNHGLLQLTLNGQPLYYFTPDLQSHNKSKAQGDELKTFGSIWHLVVAHVSGSTPQSTQSAPTTTTTGGGGGYGAGY